MKKTPVILVAPSSDRHGTEFGDLSLSISHCYAQAIQAAGGLPLVLPLTLSKVEIEECVRRAQGVMLTGGDDVHTGLYAPRGRSRGKGKANPPDQQRDWMEMALIQAVFHQHKPLLAICRGLQILNVAFGGSLYVDIATERPNSINHSRNSRNRAKAHKITITPHSRLAKIAQSLTMAVNSCHHQAVKTLARPFRTVAVSSDGIVEAFELAPEDANLLPYLLAVQFHPERLFSHDEISLRLFRDFTRACRDGNEGTV